MVDKEDLEKMLDATRDLVVDVMDSTSHFKIIELTDKYVKLKNVLGYIDMTIRFDPEDEEYDGKDCLKEQLKRIHSWQKNNSKQCVYCGQPPVIGYRIKLSAFIEELAGFPLTEELYKPTNDLPEIPDEFWEMKYV